MMGGHDEMVTEGERAGEQAPPPVFHLTDKDKEILAMRDEDYQLQTWEELRKLICTSTSSNTEHHEQWTDDPRQHPIPCTCSRAFPLNCANTLPGARTQNASMAT